MQTNVDGFLARFGAFGAAPTPERYLALFDPDATLFDAGMPRPITVPEIPAHIEGVLALVPDFRMTPERWRERDGTIFVEASNAATLAGDRVEWRSVYVVDLRGDRVIRGRRYYDRCALYARLSPDLPALPDLDPTRHETGALAAPATPGEIVAAFESAWAERDPQRLAALFREDGCAWRPDAARPLRRDEVGSAFRASDALLADAKLDVLHQAGDASLVFAEWRLRGSLAGEAFELGGVERFDCAAGLVLHARAYFDTLELATRLAPGSGGPT